MKEATEETALIEETLAKVKFILSKDKKDDCREDTILRQEIQMIFKAEVNANTIAYPCIEKDQSELLIALLELIYFLFNMDNNIRNKLYKENLNEIKNKSIMKMVLSLTKLENIAIDIDTKIVPLYNIISGALDKKEEYTLIDYIDSVFINLSFIPRFKNLFKFQIFSLIIKFYLSPNGALLNYNEKELNIDDDTSLDLIKDLLEKKDMSDEILVQSVVILNYETLYDSIGKKNIKEILKGIKDASLKIKGIKKSALCVDKILLAFVDEMTRPNSLKKKKKNKKKKSPIIVNNEEKDLKIEKYEKELRTEKYKNNDFIKETKDIIIIKDNEATSTKEIPNDKKDKIKGKTNIIKFGDIKDIKNEINILLEKLINKNNMGNDDSKNDLEKLKNIINGLVEDMDKYKAKTDALEIDNHNIIEDMVKYKTKSDALEKDNHNMKEDIKEYKLKTDQEIDNLKSRISDLEEECEETKEILGNIQCRKFSKNFLNCFDRYLTSDDEDRIKKNKKLKGVIISERIGKKFSGAEKNKLAVIQKLITSSSDLLNEANFFAHYLIIDNYEEEIKAYKNKKNLDKIDFPMTFCYLISLNIPQEYFEDSFAFLKKYFNKKLKPKNDDNILESYLN